MDDPNLPNAAPVAALPPEPVPPQPAPPPQPVVAPPQGPPEMRAPAAAPSPPAGPVVASEAPEGFETAPAPVPPDPAKPQQFDGTDKNLDDPADANDADIADATGEGPWEAAPQPFRKRDGYPDLTSESVSIRFDRDYYPADRERFQTALDADGVPEPRARAGELKALHSDEAIAVIEAGIGHREHPGQEEAAEAQRKRWADRDANEERVKEEARRRREDDGA